MPHQCLGCGHAFEEGSSALLAGCPQCKGTKFFYSAQEVSEEERRQLQQKAQNDLRQVVAEVLQEAAPETAKELQDQADEHGWAELSPKDLRKIVKKVQSETNRRPRAKPRADDVNSPERLRQVKEARERILAELGASAPAADDETVPDTVTINDDGSYALDVKGLLEKDPIVVHKDGAYLIHLPSLFEGQR